MWLFGRKQKADSSDCSWTATTFLPVDTSNFGGELHFTCLSHNTTQTIVTFTSLSYEDPDFDKYDFDESDPGDVDDV
jgi:hypothetical protein